MIENVHKIHADDIAVRFLSARVDSRRRCASFFITSGSYPVVPFESGATAYWISSSILARSCTRGEWILESYAATTESSSRLKQFVAEGTSSQSTNKGPEVYVQAVRRAIEEGDQKAAYSMAREAAGEFPEDETLRKMVQILAPRKATLSQRQPNPSVALNREWFARHSNEYRGQWVAVRDGKILGAAKSIQDLKQQVANWREAVITQILW